MDAVTDACTVVCEYAESMRVTAMLEWGTGEVRLGCKAWICEWYTWFMLCV